MTASHACQFCRTLLQHCLTDQRHDKVNILVEVNEIKIGDVWSFSIPMYCVALLEHHYWLVLLKDSSLINTSKNHGIGWVLISYNGHGKILPIPGLDINLHGIKDDEKKEERFGHSAEGN